MARANALLVLLLPALLLFPFPYAEAIDKPELDATMAALRARGYNLFVNAIATSDLLFELLRANASFTLFSPTDTAIFSLDMALPAHAYLRVLRYHIVRGRLDLRSVHDGAAFPTLLPHHDLSISHRLSHDAEYVTVDGVDVVLPGIFYGRDVAVHGLGGILSLHRSHSFRRREPAAPPDSPLPPTASPPDLQHPPSGSPEFSYPPSVWPDLHHPPSESQKFYHPPSEAPDPSVPPARSAGQPDPWTPAWSPTAVPFPLAPAWSPATDFYSETPAPSGDFISPAMMAGEPEGPAPTPAYGRGAAQIPAETVFPGGDPQRAMGVAVGGASPPMEQGFSRGVGRGACLSSEAVGCAPMEGFGHVVDQLSRPRQRPQDDYL